MESANACSAVGKSNDSNILLVNLMPTITFSGMVELKRLCVSYDD